MVGWDDDPLVASWPGYPQLPGDRQADACVVGLGASGLAAVADLAERGLSVIGVDAGRVAAAAAGRNGGFLLAGGAAFLHRAIPAWGSAAAMQLYRQTLAELDRLVIELPEVIHRVGSIRLADDAAELADCLEHAAALRAHGIRVEEYHGELGEGIFLPDDAAMNPARGALSLAARAAAADGVALYEQTPAQSVASGRVVTPLGVISAAVVVVAVDGRLELLVPQLADRVRTARLQMLRTAPVDVRLPCPVYARWGYDYAQQTADGRLYVGGGRDRFVEDEWTDDDRTTPGVQNWIERVATRFAGRPIRVTERWAASVGYTRSGRPVVTEVDAGVVACGGYDGTGNLVGPLAARAAVALAVDGEVPPAWVDC